MSTDPAAPVGTPPATATPGATPPSGTAPPPAHTDQPNWSGFTRGAVIAAVAGWALFLIAGFANLAGAEGEEAKHAAQARFMGGYLSGFIYWVSIPLGALGLLMIRYVAKTSWGLLLTRPFEAALRTAPLMVLLFIPIVVAVTVKDLHLSPYWWSHPSHVSAPDAPSLPPANEPAANKRELATKYGQYMMKKQIEIRVEEERRERDEGIYGYLSAPGFMLNAALLFLVFGGLMYFLLKWGREASDATDPAVVDRKLEKLQNISGPGLVIFAIAMTSAATQWVMSLEPGWASTMFPVIFTVNTFLTAFAFCLALFLLVVTLPPFRGHMRPKFQIDMGTLLLAFTMLWSYTSFSQFMLVWIGNLPEEIPFYLKRSAGGWWYVSASLIALHFALPFLLLLFRDVKKHPVRLRWVATYLLVICAIDVVWWCAPAHTPHGHFPTWLIDAGAVLGIGGVWGLFFISQLKQRPLFPDNQAFLLPEGHHESH